jgi:hypothetical protein
VLASLFFLVLSRSLISLPSSLSLSLSPSVSFSTSCRPPAPLPPRASCWVRRYYVLIRREQIDEMVSSATDVMHELCTFDSASEHAECLSSLQLEEVVTFEHGPDAGLPAHERVAAIAARERDRSAGVKSKGSVGCGAYSTSALANFRILPSPFSTFRALRWRIISIFHLRQIVIMLTFPTTALQLWRVEANPVHWPRRNVSDQIHHGRGALDDLPFGFCHFVDRLSIVAMTLISADPWPLPPSCAVVPNTQVADYTFQFTFTDRVVRLRAETKSAFDQWRILFERFIPLVRPDIKHEGWLWRQQGRAWEQRYAVIQNGVLFYFRSSEDCEKFKLISARSDDSLFIAATLAEGVCSASYFLSDLRRPSVVGSAILSE